MYRNDLDQDKWRCDLCGREQTIGWDDELGTTGLPSTTLIDDYDDDVEMYCHDCDPEADFCI